MKVAIPKILAIVFLPLICVCVVNGQSRSATVISETANLRETPSQNGRVKQEVPTGTEIKVLDNKGAWYVVRIADAVGWMHGNTFRFTNSSLSETQSEPEPQASFPVVPSSRPPRVRADAPSGVSSSSAGRTYIRGPRGGCYYYSGSGRKVYVDRGLCN